MDKQREKVISKVSDSLIPNLRTLKEKIDRISETPCVEEDERTLLILANDMLLDALDLLKEVVNQMKDKEE